MLFKEYQSQSNQFKQKHEEISNSEVEKRESIIKNFENHYTNIKEQMDEEQKSLVDDLGVYLIDKETENLENSYQELMK